MKFISALMTHATLALRLKHDGTGMPTQLPAAFLLALLFMTFSLLNHAGSEGIPTDVFFKVGFVAQCYVLFLRNKLIGLIMLISVICNALAYSLVMFAGLAKEQLQLLLIAEYIMVTAAILNVLKSETKFI